MANAEYVECNFDNIVHGVKVEVKIDTQAILRRRIFKHLGSILQGNRVIDENFTHLCDKNVLLRFKTKFYRTVVRPTLLYGAKC